MTQIHSHPMVRLFMLIAVAVLLVACGSILPALAQEPGGGQQPSDPPDNPPPGQTEGGLDVDVDIHPDGPIALSGTPSGGCGRSGLGSS